MNDRKDQNVNDDEGYTGEANNGLETYLSASQQHRHGLYPVLAIKQTHLHPTTHWQSVNTNGAQQLR